MDWYDKEGKPIDSQTAMRMRYGDDELSDYARIGLDEVGDARISTVWLGLDHNFSGVGPPLIFESMVFGGDYEDDCRRYATEHEALAGHQEAVARVKAGNPPW